jgi:hypothetical protein
MAHCLCHCIMCINYVARLTDVLGFVHVILLHSVHHSCDHLEHGENKNTNIMCLSHSTVLKIV